MKTPTQAGMTREYNSLAVKMGMKTTPRLRPSASQSVEQKLDIMGMEYNIWLEENPEKDVSPKTPLEQKAPQTHPKIEDLDKVIPLAQPEEPVNQKEVEDELIKRLPKKSKEQHVIEMKEGKAYRGGSAKEIVYSCMHEGDKVSFILSEAISLGLTTVQAKQALNNIVFKDKVAHLA